VPGFQRIGLATLAPRASLRWGVAGLDGSDKIALFLSGDPQTAGTIITDSQTKIRQDTGRSAYFATFHNPDASRPISFSMSGLTLK
jgi:hypothetical protein